VRRRPRRSVGVAIAALIVIMGVIIVVKLNPSDSKSDTHSLAYLKSAMDKVPLPAGAALVDEISNEEHTDLNSYLERRYTLASADNPSDQVRAALEKAGCRFHDRHGGGVEPVTAPAWGDNVSAASGDVDILPPGTSGGGIEVHWKDARLYLRVKGGDVELT
jgi:hypothetical protein